MLTISDLKLMILQLSLSGRGKCQGVHDAILQATLVMGFEVQGLRMFEENRVEVRALMRKGRDAMTEGEVAQTSSGSSNEVSTTRNRMERMGRKSE